MSTIENNASLFGRVSFLLDVNDNATELSLPSSVIVAWLEGYERWYRHSLGVYAAKNVRLLYNRTVSIFAPYLIRISGEVCRIGDAVVANGCLFQVCLDIDESAERLDDIRMLLGHGTKMIVFETSQRSSATDPEKYEELLSVVTQAGAYISFSGSIATWLGKGLMDTSALNRGSFFFRRTSVQSAPCPSIKSFDFDPCKERFQLVIDRSGRVFPCAGLSGLSRCSLGTVFEKTAEKLLTSASLPIDIETLARQGPGVACRLCAANEQQHPQSNETLSVPHVCRICRQVISNSMGIYGGP